MMQKKLLWIIGILVVFGLVMLFSAGVVDAQKKFGSSYYYVLHQLVAGVLFGTVFMLVLARIKYSFWRKLALPMLFVAFALMIFVFVPSIGITLNGARSWIRIFGYTFQPSEFLKIALIIYFAAWFSGRSDRVRNWAYGLVPFFAVLGFSGLLLALQPDVGTLGVIVVIALGVYFVAGIDWKRFVVVLSVLLIACTCIVAMAPYRLNRIKTLLNPSIDPRGISYQVNQSLIAIGSGGIFGRGYGNSTQKLGFLPEPVGDSIFAVIGEELGLVGAGATILLFGLLCFFLSQIARAAPDTFSRLYVMGVAVWIMSQTLVNIAAASGVGPLTGLPLPFISFGGSALATLLASLGIVLNIAKRT